MHKPAAQQVIHHGGLYLHPGMIAGKGADPEVIDPHRGGPDHNDFVFQGLRRETAVQDRGRGIGGEKSWTSQIIDEQAAEAVHRHPPPPQAYLFHPQAAQSYP